MRKLVLAVGLAVLLCSPGLGQSPPVPTVPYVKVVNTVTVDPGIPAPLVVETNGKNVAWDMPDKGIVLIDGGFFNGDSKRALVFGNIPGKYRVWVRTSLNDVISPVAEIIVTVNGVAPPPTPVPVPPPNPGPLPNPITKATYVVAIEDATQRTTATAVVLGDVNYWNTLTSKGYKWRIYDISETFAQTPDAKKAVDKAGGLPALLFLDDKGVLLNSVKLPATTSDMDKLLK